MPHHRASRELGGEDPANVRLWTFGPPFVGLSFLPPVLEAACGTGLNFPLIQAAIGPQGRLIGVDLSPEMLAVANDRVSRSRWRNVTLIQSPMDEAPIPEPIDAVLFCLTHDVMRSPSALRNVMRSVKHGGHVVAAGAKWAPWWKVVVGTRA